MLEFPGKRVDQWDETLITSAAFQELLSSGTDTSCCYKLSDVKFTPSFDLVKLINSLNFSHDFCMSGRKTTYFGIFAYEYAGTYHPPTPFSSNKFVLEMFNFVSNSFPLLNLNSCLLNYYPDTSCTIPLHSDNESSIDPHSFIITLSLGCTRTLTFKKICHSNLKLIDLVSLSNGEVIAFSKTSQRFFKHGLVPEGPITKLPRVSATFRRITPRN